MTTVEPVVAPEIWSAVGRRKTATARVQLKRGTGLMIINRKEADKFFTTEHTFKLLKKAFQLCDVVNQFDLVATCRGGGITGQAEAVNLGIARCLVQINPNFESPLRKNGLLTRDSRMVER
ncbi:MAG TPA: 30S ribosomal protein S9 [Planctomycetota bacterium]|nr:30S ribosomal protein S9 [Planctomycetota bacterium]